MLSLYLQLQAKKLPKTIVSLPQHLFEVRVLPSSLVDILLVDRAMHVIRCHHSEQQMALVLPQLVTSCIVVLAFVIASGKWIDAHSLLCTKIVISKS